MLSLRDRPAALRRAMSEAAAGRVSGHAGHQLVVVANEALAGSEPRELILRHGCEDMEVDVLAPMLECELGTVDAGVGPGDKMKRLSDNDSFLLTRIPAAG